MISVYRRLRFDGVSGAIVDEHGIGRCFFDDAAELLRCQVGRAKDQPSRDAVEFHQRDGGRQLFAGRQHH